MATEKVDLKRDSKLRDELMKIVNENCKEIPYEGIDVNKQGIVDGILEYLEKKHYSLLYHLKSK